MPKSPHIPVRLVRQITSYHCFPACLESFLRENGETISQAEIVKKCPAVFCEGTKEEGAFSALGIPHVEKAFGLRITPVSGAFNLLHPKETFFLLCFYQGREDWTHWLRFAGMDSDKIYFMNPGPAPFPEEVLLTDFYVWKMLNFYKVEKL